MRVAVRYVAPSAWRDRSRRSCRFEYGQGRVDARLHEVLRKSARAFDSRRKLWRYFCDDHSCGAYSCGAHSSGEVWSTDAGRNQLVASERRQRTCSLCAAQPRRNGQTKVTTGIGEHHRSRHQSCACCMFHAARCALHAAHCTLHIKHTHAHTRDAPIRE